MALHGAKDKAIAYLISLTLSFILHSLVTQAPPQPCFVVEEPEYEANSAYVMSTDQSTHATIIEYRSMEI